MNHPQYDYAVIGGDRRQVYLAEELSRSRNQVCHYALMAEPEFLCQTDFPCTAAASLEEACSHTDCVVCPIPFLANGQEMNHTIPGLFLSPDALLSFLHPGQTLFAGCIPQQFQSKAEQQGIHVCDLMQDPSLAIYNTIATAEGAICEAITRSPQNLHRSMCAVLGYGKCAYTLTQYLKGMFCHVHVYSREETERTQAALVAEDTASLIQLEENAGRYDFIFNTIPAPVVTSRILAGIKPSATIIDIASAPGGVDYTEARRLGVNAAHCLGLPGKYAPSSSAKAIRASIEAFLSKERQDKKSKKRSDRTCH